MTFSLTYIEIDVPVFTDPSSPPSEETETWRFAIPCDYLPASIPAIPSIESVDFTPAEISLGKDLGIRASLAVSFRDHRHIFDGEPYSSGTFFGKWRARYGVRLRGRNIRLIRGELGQALIDMDTRHYTIDTTDGPNFGAVYSISAKDILKVADDDRSQAPIISQGSLAGSINASVTSATLSPTGIGNLEYPSSGYITFGGKEIVSFTRSGDALTIVRGQFGSIAQSHDSGDRAQLTLRYSGNDAADIIYDLLVNYAFIDPSFINLAEWQEETANYLGVIYARTITEPTAVNDLISQLIEQAALAVYWDDRARKIRLKVLREISTDTATFTQDEIIAGSFSVSDQADKRISQIWSYYGQRDPTDGGAEEDNYRSVKVDVDLGRETSYGSAEIVKVRAAWVETETAATRFNSIQLSRFRDPPRAFGFDLIAGTNITPAGGYQLEWWGNQSIIGELIPALIQVTKVQTFPDRVHIEAEEMLASGVVALVNVVFLTATGGVFSWSVPGNWNDADNSIACIGGGGGGGGRDINGGGGGGGGAYSSIANLTLAGPTASYRVGAAGVAGTTGDGTAGGDSWFNGATLGASSVGAKGGGAGLSISSAGGDAAVSGGAGGASASGVGSVRISGGDGGNGTFGVATNGGGGGGGSAGPNGAGADGGSVQSNRRGGGGGGGADDGSAGGQGVNDGEALGGNNRFGFGGGTNASPTGQEGGGGVGGPNGSVGGAGGAGEQIWTQTVAPIISAGPGGGGGGGGGSSPGAAGGLYGGGGGGAGEDSAGGGLGGRGIIVITWREA